MHTREQLAGDTRKLGTWKLFGLGSRTSESKAAGCQASSCTSCERGGFLFFQISKG
jgi:hypothetical protein